MDLIKWYHKNCAECVKLWVMCALCRKEERIWQQRTNAKKRLQVQPHRMLETAAKKIKIVRPGDNVMVTVPDMDRTKIDAQSLHAVYENLKKKRLLFLPPLSHFWQNFGIIAGTSGKFWLKCSPSITDQSEGVPSVSHKRKKIPIRETEANLCQNIPKSAMRIMRISRGLILSAFYRN